MILDHPISIEFFNTIIFNNISIQIDSNEELNFFNIISIMQVFFKNIRFSKFINRKSMKFTFKILQTELVLFENIEFVGFYCENLKNLKNFFIFENSKFLIFNAIKINQFKIYNTFFSFSNLNLASKVEFYNVSIINSTFFQLRIFVFEDSSFNSLIVKNFLIEKIVKLYSSMFFYGISLLKAIFENIYLKDFLADSRVDLGLFSLNVALIKNLTLNQGILKAIFLLSGLKNENKHLKEINFNILNVKIEEINYLTILFKIHVRNNVITSFMIENAFVQNFYKIENPNNNDLFVSTETVFFNSISNVVILLSKNLNAFRILNCQKTIVQNFKFSNSEKHFKLNVNENITQYFTYVIIYQIVKFSNINIAKIFTKSFRLIAFLNFKQGVFKIILIVNYFLLFFK